ncbi:MAG: mechanosensitive ion channel domain-containing protein [Actinomycetota bacterium]
MRLMAPPPSWVERLDKLHLLTPVRIAIVLAVAILITFFIRRFVVRLLKPVFARTAAADDPRAEARRRALSSSLRAALVGIVWSITVITVISQLGINVGAFVAVATVIGGAVGFGAQMLVRDVIAGFFVLADDQFGPGDEVDLGHARGVVERVTLRSARLRDGEGTIWYVPHGNVARVGNASKSATGPLDVEVDRAMDMAVVTSVVATLAQRLAADPDVSPILAGEPRVVGIMDIRDDRLVFRVRVPTQPGRLDDVRRAWRLLVLAAFANGDLVAPAPVIATAALRPDNSTG